jgi:hypothetical protein
MPEFGLYMTDKDILLSPDEWLTDSLIDAAQELIKRINPAIGGLQRVCCGLTMAFMVEPNEFLQIVGTGNGHWILVSTVGTRHPTVLVYDSAYCTVNYYVERQIATMLCSQEKEIMLHFINTQMQYGSGDCGLFAIAFATAIALGISPEFIDFEQSEMRQHLLTCFNNGKLTMFPYDKKRRVKNRVKATQQIKLYCKCHLPEFGEMIQCTKCDEWYHLDMCVSVQKVYLQPVVQWLCDICEQNH